MKKIVEASHTIVAQRLESGDPILNQKTGEIIYKPVSLKDAHKVAVDLMDRQHTLDKLTDAEAPSEERDDNKLEKLAEKFAEMATKSIEKEINKRRTVDVEDVEEIKNDLSGNSIHGDAERVEEDAGLSDLPDDVQS